MDVTYSFGYWVKRRRKALQLTQREVAALAHCSIITIKKIEADQRRPSRELAESLAVPLAIPANQLKSFIESARGMRPVDYLDEANSFPANISQSGLRKDFSSPPLPRSLTPIIGRAAELTLLDHLLTKSWLVTIVGIGGIGKTRLALALAEKWREKGKGVTFVTLAELSAEENLAFALLEGLEIPPATDADPIEQLLVVLQQQTFLLILDNFEHLLGNTPLLTQLHQAIPGLTFLVTSRERLKLPGEQLFPLQGLNFPQEQWESKGTYTPAEIATYPTAQLFLDNARRLLPEYTVTDEAALVKLCQVTAGLPLAIELAASWVDTLTLSDLAQAYEQSLSSLTLVEPTRPARHQSIQAAFDVSWQLLSQDEQEAFTRLSFFQGGFTRQSAKQVTEVSLPELSSLVIRNLVNLDQSSGRYYLHELMRQYGVEKLGRAPKNKEVIQKRHANYFCKFLTSQEQDLKNKNQVNALSEIRAERANIWLAWHWIARHPNSVSLTPAIMPLGIASIRRSWIREVNDLFNQTARSLLEFNDHPDVQLSLLLLNVWRCRFVHLLGEPVEDILENTRYLLEMVPRSPSLRPILAFWHLVAQEVFLDIGEREQAQFHSRKSLGFYEGLDDNWGQSEALAQLGSVFWNTGNYDKAHQLFDESLKLKRQIGDRLGEAAVLDRLGLLAMHQGELEVSNRYLQQAARLFEDLGDKAGLAGAMENLGSCWLEMGRLDGAYRQYAKTAALYDQLGIRHTGYTVLKALAAFTSVHLGEYDRAINEAQKALELSREAGHTRSEGLAMLVLAKAKLAISDDAAAAVLAEKSCQRLRSIDQQEELAMAIGVQAISALRLGELDMASRNIESALTITCELQGLSASPGYSLAAYALLLDRLGRGEQATDVIQLLLAEPFSAASHWFADIIGQKIPHSPPDHPLPIEERWAAIDKLRIEFPQRVYLRK